MRFLSVVRHLRFLLIAFLVLIAVILLVFFLPTAPEPSANQTAKKGVFDLRGWDFRQDGNVKLTGEWEFYWNQFLPPEGYRQRLAKGSQNSDFVTLPRTWNGQFVNGKELSGFGYASYRLTVRLSETDRVLSVLVKPMATAYDLWINGERIAFNGKIGTSAKSMEPRYLSRVAAFKPSGPDIEILLRVSNFMHRRGGVWRAIIMGDHDTITQLRDNSIAKDWMLSAGLIILGMYHLAVFFQRRKDTEAFYLAGFCLFMALRVWLVGERLLYAALANFSWELSHKLEYLSVMISVMFLFTFVQKLYPDEYRAKIQYLVNGVILLFILTVLVTRSRIYSWIIIPFEVFGLIIGIYIIYVIYRAIRNKRTNARLMMAAVVVVALFGLNDVLHANQIIYTTELFHLGVMLAALLQTLVLSRIFVNALENSEQLSTELARRNAILDESNRLKENRSRELELQLFRSQKLEAIGTLTGGIAHDFNNILGTMMGYIEMLIDTKSESSEERTYLEQVYKAGERAADLVDQILTFSRTSESNLKPLNIAPLVKGVLKMVRATLPTTIEIIQNIDGNCRSIMANETQIHQVIVNLCANAGQAIGKNSGTVEISVSEITDDIEHSPAAGLVQGPCLQLAVRDTGCGMTPEVQEQIFDPFFTTKEVGSGTGLGLSVVHGIIKNHGGEIAVTSTPGKGTTISIFFPIVENVTRVETEEKKPIPGGKEHILIVDDEVALAKFYGLAMEKLGYRVSIRNTGSDALALVHENPARFDLVFTDQAMPGMNGIQLSKNIKSIQPDLPIILATGFCTDLLIEEANAAGIRDVLKKPIKFSQLAQTIHTVFNGTA